MIAFNIIICFNLNTMITDSDVKKLRTVFATKEDLKRFATKEDLQESTNQLVELITAGFDRTDKAIERLNQHDEIIDNHEHRLDRLEDKVFA